MIYYLGLRVHQFTQGSIIADAYTYFTLSSNITEQNIELVLIDGQNYSTITWEYINVTGNVELFGFFV